MPDEPEFRFERMDRTSDEILKNLFNLYAYDLAEYFGFDSSPDGRYHYDTDGIWGEGAGVWFAWAGELPAGFALVAPGDEWIDSRPAWDLEEFFVLRRYRRLGLGARFAHHVWSQYPGAWVVRVFTGNLPAMPFWRGAVKSFDPDAREEQVMRDDRLWCHHFLTVGQQ